MNSPLAASPKPAWPKPDWARIDTVVSDLDGTLLDLAFDNYFWLEHIPQAYARARAITLQEAREQLTPRFRAYEGTLNWYCIEHWSRELELDVPALKREAGTRIVWLPGAREFLLRLREQGKRLVLLTNAHPETLRIKDDRTGVCSYFDASFSSHQFGAPKEDPRCWEGLQKVEPLNKDRTLFIDDSPPVLRAARNAGIRWVYAIQRPDSTRDRRDHTEVPAVESVLDLL